MPRLALHRQQYSLELRPEAVRPYELASSRKLFISSSANACGQRLIEERFSEDVRRPALVLQRHVRRGQDDYGASEPASVSQAVAQPWSVQQDAWQNNSFGEHRAASTSGSEEGGRKAAEGSVLGAVALITGSTVGAGILALPAVAAPAGFGPSTAVLTACWALLAAEALLLAEVNIALRERRQKEAHLAEGEVVTLRQMAESTGIGGGIVSSLYLMLSYSLLVAYISKGSDIVQLLSCGRLPPWLAGTVFTAALGSALFAGSTRTADMLNRGLTAGLMVLFGVIILTGSAQADWGILATSSDWSAAPATMPIIFLSLVYHDLIPVVCGYLGGDRRRICTALLAGSALPLAMFATWNAVSLSSVPLVPPAAVVAAAAAASAGAEGQAAVAADAAGAVTTAALDPLDLLMHAGNGALGAEVQAFSLLAIVTSFIGTMLGLSSTLTSELNQAISWLQRGSDAATAANSMKAVAAPRKDMAAEIPSNNWSRAAVFLVALGPPLGISAANPGAFFDVLQAAGAYGMTALYGIAPPLMAWSLRHPRMASRGMPVAGNASVVDATPVRRARLSAHGDVSTLSSPKAKLHAVLRGEREMHRAHNLVPGGRWVLAVLCCCATGIEVAQALASVYGH